VDVKQHVTRYISDCLKKASLSLNISEISECYPFVMLRNSHVDVIMRRNSVDVNLHTFIMLLTEIWHAGTFSHK